MMMMMIQLFLWVRILQECNILTSNMYTSPTPYEQQKECCVKMLSCVPSKYTVMAQIVWEAPIMKRGTHQCNSSPCKRKNPRPYGLTTNFFKVYWSFLNFIIMVSGFLAHGRFPRGVTQGLIAILSKEEDQMILATFNSTQPYLQHLCQSLKKSVHPLLMEVNDNDQFVFLPLKSRQHYSCARINSLA